MHRRLLPILDPCGEDFDSMERDGSRLRCERCKTSVHDLSAMTRAEARLLLLRKRGQQICVRYDTRPDGELRFRPPPTRTVGVLVTALAGLMAACTGTGEVIELPTADTIIWDDDDTIIPGGHTEYELGLEGELGIPGGIVGGIMGTVGGAMVVGSLECEGLPSPEIVLAPLVRPPKNTLERRPVSRREAHKRARKQRRAERKERRRLQRRTKEVEREQQREIRQAEREVVQESRRAERKHRRLARKAERKRRRQLRRKRRVLRREARRAGA